MTHERWVKRPLAYRLHEGDTLYPGDAALHAGWGQRDDAGQVKPSPLAPLPPGDYDVWVLRALEARPGMVPCIRDLELAIIPGDADLKEMRFDASLAGGTGPRLYPRYMGLLGFWSKNYWSRTRQPFPGKAHLEIEEQRQAPRIPEMREVCASYERRAKLDKLYALLELQHQVDTLPRVFSGGVGLLTPSWGPSFAELRLGWRPDSAGAPFEHLAGAKLVLVPEEQRATMDLWPWPTDLIDLLEELGLFGHPEVCRLTKREEK